MACVVEFQFLLRVLISLKAQGSVAYRFCDRFSETQGDDDDDDDDFFLSCSFPCWIMFGACGENQVCWFRFVVGVLVGNSRCLQ